MKSWSSLCLLVVACVTSSGCSDRSKGESIKTDDARLTGPAAEYVPDSRVIDCLLTCDGVTFAVYPAWSVEKVGNTVTLASMEDERVRVSIQVSREPNTSSSESASWQKSTTLSRSGTKLDYTMKKLEGGRTSLQGVAFSQRRFLRIDGEFFESTKGDKRRAGELWQMMHWIQFSAGGSKK